MSHRRWRQSVAPGVSPGNPTIKNCKPSKRATEISFAPTGLLNLWKISYPGLTSGATNMPPAKTGSLNSIPTDSSNPHLLFSIPTFNFYYDS